ncbi:MAG: hypothetical protein JJU02_10200 [Cryomorphaceae bacterium]|nr:hypothetical protein [Cryomorphaceae bacterium]
MRCSTISFLIVLFFAGATGFAQMERHSFGAGLVNGFIYVPAEGDYDPTVTHPTLNTNIPAENPAKNVYLSGVHGSHLKTTKNWLAWRTNFNMMVSSRYEDFPEEFEGFFIRHNQRGFYAELGFGPMFTYQKEDYGVFLGGTFDLMYFISNKKGVTNPDNERWYFAEFPFPTVSTYLGYWQRMGNVNSPWFLEIMFKRRHVSAIPALFTDARGPYMYSLMVGFRYELQN